MDWTKYAVGTKENDRFRLRPVGSTKCFYRKRIIERCVRQVRTGNCTVGEKGK